MVVTSSTHCSSLTKARKLHKPTIEHILGECHKVVVIGERHVKLAHSKFRIVRQIDAFVAELSADLVNALDATHNQSLRRGVYAN